MTGATGQSAAYRIGIDLGGTKIAGILLDANETVIGEQRIATPRADYDATLQAIATLVAQLTAHAPATSTPTIGIGMPGSLTADGTVQNANSTSLNARPFQQDLEATLGAPVRCANDANCFALSEAHDGAAQGARSVFGIILGTGCGGGLIFDGRLLNGPRNIGGEWGHNPLPWPHPSEVPGPACWCGSNGCLETWIAGPAIAADHHRETGAALSAEQIMDLAETGDQDARASRDRHTSRLARGIAHVINILDPAVVVLGGGLSARPHLYQQLPVAIAPYIFADDRTVDIRQPRWGDASGVRGAARLWSG